MMIDSEKYLEYLNNKCSLWHEQIENDAKDCLDKIQNLSLDSCFMAEHLYDICSNYAHIHKFAHEQLDELHREMAHLNTIHKWEGEN